MFGIQRRAWKIFFWANWLIIFIFWWLGSGNLIFQNLPNFSLALGRLAGLTAAYMILLQFFFMGRTPWLERVFGLDKLSRLHHTNGQWGFVFLLLHPLLVTYAYGSFFGNSFFGQFIDFIFKTDDLFSAFAGFSLFTVVVASSFYIVIKRLRYESWHIIHLAAYAAILVSLPHQIELGGTLNSNIIFYGYWILLYVAVFAHHFLFRFAKPVYNFYRHEFFVSRVQRENYNTISVYIGGKDLNKFKIYPGQFMILRFFAEKIWWQAHPFSLSAVPEGKELRVTIKELGDFTRQLMKYVREGTKVMIEGPYGTFHELFSVSPKVLLIAGGIGITPIRSLMERLLEKGKNVVLLYANRTEKDIVFRNELQEVAKKYPANVIHVLSNEPEFAGEKGLIDREKLERLVPDLLSREVFICGPSLMMDSLVKTFRAMGMPPLKIHHEKFSL